MKKFGLAGVIGCLIVGLCAVAQARMSPKDIYKNKATGVVLIVASQEGSSSASAGTGSIIKDDGTIITNCHVIYNETGKAPFQVIHIFLKPDKLTGDMNRDLTKHFMGQVLAYDQALDLALLKMKDPPANLNVITLGDPDEVGPGDETAAIGHPEQAGLWTITTGVIGTEFEDFKGVPGKAVFQMETSLNRGNSGGPLFDIRGYQVGVNTSIARVGEGGVAITGVNFAVKASVVQRWASKHSLAIAFGSESLAGPADARVAVAEAPKPQQQPEVASPTQPAKQPETAPTYRDPESGGTIQVEEGSGEDDSGVIQSHKVAQAPVKNEPPPVVEKKPRPKHKPVRFGTTYKTPRRPYTYKKLFSAVDKVRKRAADAFDDLDGEMRRRQK